MTDAEMREAWDAQALTLEDACRATGAHDPQMTSACLEQIQTWLPPSLEPLRLLEIGCGIGRLTFPMARACPRATIVGVDASAKMLQYARESRGPTDGSGIHFIQSCRPSPYGFGTEFYDGAYSVLTLQHLAPDLAKEYIVAVGKALKFGGMFVFQFIEGDECQPLSNHFGFETVRDWCHEGGCSLLASARGHGHELWTWMTCRKEYRA